MSAGYIYIYLKCAQHWKPSNIMFPVRWQVACGVCTAIFIYI